MAAMCKNTAAMLKNSLPMLKKPHRTVAESATR